MAEKRSASPPAPGEEPPSKKTAGAQSKTYVFNSTKDISRHLRLKKVSKFFIEVLDLDTDDGPNAFDSEGNRSNHCIARVVFRNKQDNDTEHTPLGTTGVIIDFEYDGGMGTKCTGGYVNVKTVSYDGPHRHAVKVVEIPFRRRYGAAGRKPRTLTELFDVLEKSNLVPCGFNTEGPRIRGCKDFL